MSEGSPLAAHGRGHKAFRSLPSLPGWCCRYYVRHLACHPCYFFPRCNSSCCGCLVEEDVRSGRRIVMTAQLNSMSASPQPCGYGLATALVLGGRDNSVAICSTDAIQSVLRSLRTAGSFGHTQCAFTQRPTHGMGWFTAAGAVSNMKCPLRTTKQLQSAQPFNLLIATAAGGVRLD